MFLLLFFLSFQAQAQTITAEQLSYGGAGALNPSSVGAFSLNPATITIHSDLEMGASFFKGDFREGQDQETYNIWFKDSIANALHSKRNQSIKTKFNGEEGFPFAAAFAFSKNNFMGRSYKQYQLALAKALKRNWSFGSNMSFFNLGKGYDKSQAWMGSLGFLYRFTTKFNLGLSWLSLVDDQNVAETLYNFEEKLRMAGHWKPSESLEVFGDLDCHLDSEREGYFSYGMAVALKVRQFFIFRTGYFLHRTEALDLEGDLGLGLGFNGPRLKMNYGVRFQTKSNAALHSIDFQMPLW